MFMRKVQPYLAALLAVAVSAPPSVAQQRNPTESDSAWYRATDRPLHSARCRADQSQQFRAPGCRSCALAGCIYRCRMRLRSRSKIIWILNYSDMARRSRKRTCSVRRPAVWLVAFQRAFRKGLHPLLAYRRAAAREPELREQADRLAEAPAAERMEPPSCLPEPRYRRWMKLRSRITAGVTGPRFNPTRP